MARKLACLRSTSTLITGTLSMYTDAEDIGCIYNDQSYAAGNTAALKVWLDGLIANQDSAGLAITGPKVSGNNRVAGTLYVDCTNGPAVYNPYTGDPNTSKTFGLIGLPGSVLYGDNGSPTNPVVHFSGPTQGKFASFIRDLSIYSADGSCVKISKGHSFGAIESCRLEAKGSGTMTADDMTDLDTASYGLLLDTDTPVPHDGFFDGFHVRDLQIMGCANHGMIVKRWQDGYGHISQIHSSGGCGFKGLMLSGCELNMRCESNGYWGCYLEDCGRGGINQIQVWTENNNGRGINLTPTDSYRQNRFRECTQTTVRGHNGWASNKVDIDWATRNAMELVERLWLPISATPVKTLTDVDITDHNHSAAWLNATYRPTLVTAVDDIIEISIPTQCNDNRNQQALWYPFGDPVTGISVSEGDLFIYSIEIESMLDADDHCKAEEATRTNRAEFGDIKFGQFGGVSNVNEGQSMLCLWDKNPRKLSGRTFARANANNLRLRISLGYNGLSGPTPGVGDIQFRINDLQLWHLPTS